MFTDLSHRALLFALCSFIMCACFATCYLAQNRTETFLDFSPAPTLILFPKCLTSHRFAAASNATSGREQRYLRPRAARTAAASRQLLLIARKAPTEWWRRSVKDVASAAANARREGRPECPIPPVAKRCYPRLFSPSPPRFLSPSFSAIIIYNQRKEK